MVKDREMKEFAKDGAKIYPSASWSGIFMASSRAFPVLIPFDKRLEVEG